jgi:hypothetical protein
VTIGAKPPGDQGQSFSLAMNPEARKDFGVFCFSAFCRRAEGPPAFQKPAPAGRAQRAHCVRPRGETGDHTALRTPKSGFESWRGQETKYEGRRMKDEEEPEKPSSSF